MIREFRYAAESWKTERRLVTRLEFGSQGRNPRFVVTNLERPAQALYDELYCQRGEAENRIKEVQLDLFGTRASCHTFLANWLRLLLAALAYTLMQRLRTLALASTALAHAHAHAQAATIRVKLLKIGALIPQNVLFPARLNNGVRGAAPCALKNSIFSSFFSLCFAKSQGQTSARCSGF